MRAPRPLKTQLGGPTSLFLLATALCCLLIAWLDVRGAPGDSIAYFDLSDAVRLHRWHACLNASWFPLYPAALTAARALTGFRPVYEAASARLLNGLLALAFLACSTYLAYSLRRLAAAHDPATRLLPLRTLTILTVAVAFFFWSVDMEGVKPDTLLACFLLLATALLVRGLTPLPIADRSLSRPEIADPLASPVAVDQGYEAPWSDFLLAGLCAGLAYWTKAFAFPFACLLYLFLAVSQLRRPRLLVRITASAALFLAIAAPYIAGISRDKHRVTIGDAGRLNSAWYVNGAERFNPVTDPTVDDRGSAKGNYLHPAQLLSITPEIVFYSPTAPVFGHFPPWDDFSYFSDGLASRFSLAQTLRACIHNLKFLAALVPMRLEALLLLAAPVAFGYRLPSLQRPSVEHAPLPTSPYPVLAAVIVSAMMAVALYIGVHLEGRYVVFAAIILGTALAANLQLPSPTSAWPPAAERALLLLGWLLIITTAQTAIHEFKNAGTNDQPLHARFDRAAADAGEALAARLPPAAQVACLGLEACYGNALWSRYADARISAVITLPHQMESASPAAVSAALEAHPEALATLRAHEIRAIVANFRPTSPCSSVWTQLPGDGHYFAIFL